MANDDLQHKIEFEQQQEEKQDQRGTDNQIIALVTFERGGRVQAQFEFELVAETIEKENYDSYRLKKIQLLHIQFV